MEFEIKKKIKPDTSSSKVKQMIEQSKEKIFGLLYEKQMRELDFFYEL
jgi:hypothetical protein